MEPDPTPRFGQMEASSAVFLERQREAISAFSAAPRAPVDANDTVPLNTSLALPALTDATASAFGLEPLAGAAYNISLLEISLRSATDFG